MHCVRSVRYSVRCNGELLEPFIPSRGLRQGDPLSPYLFVICAEGLSALLQDAERNGKISGIKVCPTTPTVSHLFFADDSFLLLKARKEEAQALHNVPALYENCSGQRINLSKSSVFFSKGCPNIL